MAVSEELKTGQMQRVLTCSRGSPLPLGASPAGTGVNFAVFARHATSMTLSLFPPGKEEGEAQVHLDPGINRTGHIWHVFVRQLPQGTTYGWRASGPYDPDGEGHRYNHSKLLLDPYCKELAGEFVWDNRALLGYEGKEEDTVLNHRDSAPYAPKCSITGKPFDWEGDRFPKRPLKDSIIYEVHLRGFTRHHSSGVRNPGTFSGFKEKIPYLKQLGVTAVELLPIFEFSEHDNVRVNPETGEKLSNYWGYNSISFFAPKSSYASRREPGEPGREFKDMVKALHREGIEVILDVVYNHTAEGDHLGPTFSLRGLDNKTYYMLSEQKRYYRNYSGCGNTFNCNHPLVRDLVLDSLRYWVVEMHVDGFRFDLASILGRDQDGSVLSNPPLLERIANEPVLADSKIIAEAWDAAGLYQVGSFPAAQRWAEWNGRYRDDVRRFVRGDPGMAGAIATRIAGSSDLYKHDGRSPYHSINFFTSHDGFTLQDLVSYNNKHNEMNGEDNLDGTDADYSWNCGVEGDTGDPVVLALRKRQRKNFWTILMVSQGVPMVLSGDECGRTQLGNNNAYCQDNEIGWLDWSKVAENRDLFDFVCKLTRFRHSHPALRRHSFLVGRNDGSSAVGDITWHGKRPNEPCWNEESRLLAFLLGGEPSLTLGEEDDDIYVVFNMGSSAVWCDLPPPREERKWYRAIDTSLPAPEDILPEGKEKLVPGQRRYRVHARTSVVLLGR